MSEYKNIDPFSEDAMSYRPLTESESNERKSLVEYVMYLEDNNFNGHEDLYNIALLSVQDSLTYPIDDPNSNVDYNTALILKGLVEQGQIISGLDQKITYIIAQRIKQQFLSN